MIDQSILNQLEELQENDQQDIIINFINTFLLTTKVRMENISKHRRQLINQINKLVGSDRFWRVIIMIFKNENQLNSSYFEKFSVIDGPLKKEPLIHKIEDLLGVLNM